MRISIVLLGLGSDHTGRDDVEISQAGVSPHVPTGLFVTRNIAVEHAVANSFFDVG